jgi:hypothetical protein
MLRPCEVSTSTVKKSAPASTAIAGGHEILPRNTLASLGRRRDPVSAKDVAHRLTGNGMPEIGGSSYDAVVTPSRCRPGEIRNLDPSNLQNCVKLMQARQAYFDFVSFEGAGADSGLALKRTSMTASFRNSTSDPRAIKVEYSDRAIP